MTVMLPEQPFLPNAAKMLLISAILAVNSRVHSQNCYHCHPSDRLNNGTTPAEIISANDRNAQLIRNTTGRICFVELLMTRWRNPSTVVLVRDTPMTGVLSSLMITVSFSNLQPKQTSMNSRLRSLLPPPARLT